MTIKEKLLQLRKEITLNSIYTKDYDNSLDIPLDIVYYFFEGFNEYIYDLMKRDKIKPKKYEWEYDNYDNIDNLFNYYNDIENPKMELYLGN